MTTTTDQAGKLNVDIQSLEIIKVRLKDEIESLREARLTLQGKLEQAQRQYQSLEDIMKTEYEVFNQRKVEAERERARQMSGRERDLGALADQLANREAQVSDLEKLQAELYKEKQRLQNDALSVERMRAQIQTELEQAQALKKEQESIWVQINHTKENNGQQLKENKELKDRLVSWEGRLEHLDRDLSLRQRSINEASAGLVPKLSELDEKQEKLKEIQKSQQEKEAMLLDWENRLKTLESTLLEKDRQYRAKELSVATS